MSKQPNSEEFSKDLSEVIEAGIRILAYAPNTEKQLTVKLKRKGFTSNLISEAIDYFIARGYLNDADYIQHVVENLANHKLYGIVRIKNELYRMGFSYELINEVSFDDIDFEYNCAKMLRKRGGQLDEKTFAALRRYGYGSGDIRAAAKLLKEE